MEKNNEIKVCQIVPTSCGQQYWMLISHRGFLSINWLCVTMKKTREKTHSVREWERNNRRRWKMKTKIEIDSHHEFIVVKQLWAYISDHKFYDNHHFNWVKICSMKIKFWRDLTNELEIWLLDPLTFLVAQSQIHSYQHILICLHDSRCLLDIGANHHLC